MASKLKTVQIAHASYRYVDPDGRERIALRGETVDIDPDAYDQHLPMGAFVEEAPEDEEKDGTPVRSASKADWVAYATDEARGDDRLTPEDADAATRDELAERYLGAKE